MAAVWGCLLLAVLQVRYLPIDSQHSVCGPWGCGPPLPPLIAYHGFWLVLLSLPTILACRGLDDAQLRWLGRIVAATGISGLFIIGVWDMIPALPHWLLRVGNMPTKYLVHRYLLAVATLVDVPVVQIALAGITCSMTARAKQRGRNQTRTDEQCVVVFEDGKSPAGKA